MRVLTKAEQNEFDLTFNFINFYIGALSYLTKSPSDIRINEMPLPYEIIQFINVFSKVKEIPELDLKFNYNDTQLHKINLIFNECSEERKALAMKRLINYCFKNKVQPSKLRIIEIKSVNVLKNKMNDDVVVMEFKNEENPLIPIKR